MPEGLGHQSYRLWVPALLKPHPVNALGCVGLLSCPSLGISAPEQPSQLSQHPNSPEGVAVLAALQDAGGISLQGLVTVTAAAGWAQLGWQGPHRSTRAHPRGSIPAWSPALGGDSEVLEPLYPWDRQVCAPRLLTPLSAEPSPAPCDSSSFDKPWLSFGFNQNCSWHLCPAGWRGPRG